jgi:hypothetical protein
MAWRAALCWAAVGRGGGWLVADAGTPGGGGQRQPSRSQRMLASCWGVITGLIDGLIYTSGRFDRLLPRRAVGVGRCGPLAKFWGE